MTGIAGPQISAVISSVRSDSVVHRQRALAMARFRLLWVLIGFAALAFIALARLTQLGFAAGDRGNGAAGMAVDRGDIVDRNGVPLARAFPAYSLWFNPNALHGGPALVKSPREVAEALVRIFPDENVDDLTRRLAAGKPGYLKRRILPEDANRIHALGEPALEFPRENERYYPQGSMAAHVLGYVDSDGHGQVGMEKVFDHQLTDPVTRGNPLVLSIDARVQGVLEDELAKGLARAQAKSAGGIIMDVETGEVLALASLPSFNPNLIDRQGSEHAFNLVVSQPYELGSVIKPITVATAIEAGVITSMARRYPAGKPLSIAGFEIHDDENFGDSLNIPEALIHSSNIVLAQVGDQLGATRLRTAMEKLGFAERPYIELPARGLPRFPHADHGEWSRVTTMTASFGHGFAITPLHLACAYAALVNGGIWHPATLQKLAPGQAPAGRRVFSAATSARMRQLLRVIVEVGTGRSANAPGFRVGGKTGTAERSDRFGYHRDQVVATFASAFPMDHPRYVVIAMLDTPQANAATSYQRTAAWNSAPIVGRVVPRVGPLLGIMPDQTRDIDISDLKPLIANGDGE
ncbi:MAG TPA: penicillin-binding protein 2 [Novosphingobium sp.]|nr:penicillin-binding protein 2 [Novosphingobium sp.]